MNFSAPFIARPIGTMLLAIGLLLAGAVAYRFLPVAPLPSVDIPTIVVFANRPGADPQTMATSIAAPLERHLGEIPGVTELTSTSGTGVVTIVAQFDIDRDIDGAAHDVQAALNAATADIPGDLPTRPYYRKFNPALFPILTIALTSDSLPLSAVYDAADTILVQRLSQVPGVAQVTASGAEKPAIRVRLSPAALAAAGLSSLDVNAAIKAANVDGPVGGFDGPDRAETIALDGQIDTPRAYAGLVLKANGPAVTRLADVGRAVAATANAKVGAWSSDKPAILLQITRLADANVIETVDRVRRILPRLESYLPAGIDLAVVRDGTPTIRASVGDVSITLLVTIALVLLVVLAFMRRLVPIAAAGVTIPLSIAGTLAAMWLCGFSLDNFSLMALTISVGFVVDDAIVMIENIVRHVEQGDSPMRAALRGSRQIGFTVLSISASLVAVFIPVLFLGGILGRLFREFAVTLTLAIVVSALVSLTLTPMLCARFLPPRDTPPAGLLGRLDRGFERAFRAVLRLYAASLGWALRRRRLMLAVTIGTVVLTIWLYGQVPKGFMPVEDTGALGGFTIASLDISYPAMVTRQRAVVAVIERDPAIASVTSVVTGSTGWNPQLHVGELSIALKPLAARHHVSSEAVIARLRPRLAGIGGMRTILYSSQDIRAGGREGTNNQFVLIDQDFDELRVWAARLESRLRAVPILADVSSDLDRAGPQVTLAIDREAASRLGVTVQAIDQALSNAFSQRQISIMYTERNQYWVVLEVDPALQTDPAYLGRLFVPGAGGAQVPLGAVARILPGTAPLAVRHQGQFPAATIGYNIVGHASAQEAVQAIERAVAELRVPPSLHTDFAGNTKFFQNSVKAVPLLILAALVAIYVILGVLYESLAQPLTILSTLPSAGIGALLALLLTGLDLTIIAVIGILLLMGLVKKNAIMLVDFALEEERRYARSPAEAIHAACIERFRPIIMTTLAALLGAVPLAIGGGTGAELRQPLGIAIIGGLIVSQILTLYTTPVVYLALQPRRGARPIPLPQPAE